MATYEGGAYIEQGLESFGHSIAQGIERWQKQRQEEMQQQAGADAQMMQLAKTPDPSDPAGKKMVLDAKSYERYLGYSGQKRAAIAAGIKSGMEISQMMSETADKHLTAEAQRRHLTASANREIMESSGQGGFTPKIVTLKDEQGQPVQGPTGKPMQVYYRSPLQVEMVPGTDVQIRTDPQSGAMYVLDAKGNPHFLTGQQAIAGQIARGGAPLSGAPGQQGTSTFNVTGDQGKVAQFGKPSGAKKPTSTTKTTSAEDQDAQAQANEIRRQYKAGKISKDDAVKALQALGFG